jgi:LysR family transcriptional regulator, benzoate and cis,cis-muconate-responsive activator of ben and cat genes
MLQVQRLEGFYWVAFTGGYARAARAFPYPITQPAVHQQVKKLERELDMTLFERVGKDQMQLTPAGEYLYAFIAPFFRDLPAVTRTLQSHRYGGRLSIYAEPMMLRHLLPAWLKRVQKKRPEIHIDLRELTEVSVEELRSGKADILVAYLPDEHDDIATMQVATLHPFLVIPRDHRLASRSRIAVADLKDETFIAYHEDMIAHRLQLQALLTHGVQPERIITTSSADSILGFVESGLGYSLVPSLSPTGPKTRGIIARAMLAPKVEFPVVAAWRKDAPENPLLDTALECAP